jgi:hypothetical protein
MSDPRREAVWLALSELWRDIELDAASLENLAQVLRGSGYPQDELEAIYRLEVAPVVWLNTWTTAGVWDGFDPAWLFEGCRRNQRLRTSRRHRWRCRLLRRPMTHACEHHWQELIHRMHRVISGRP